MAERMYFPKWLKCFGLVIVPFKAQGKDERMACVCGDDKSYGKIADRQR